MAFYAELQKARRRHDLLLCMLVPLIVLFWIGRLEPGSEEELANGYSALFYSMPVINAILLPVAMAVIASRLWDMEVRGGTMKLLYTLQSRSSLFLGKAALGLLEVTLMTALEMGGVALLGGMQGYTEAFPAAQFAYLTVCTFAVEVMLFFSELQLMIRFGSPMAALCVGIVGALLGLFSAFMPPVVSLFVPWGYFEPLSAYVVAEWNRETHLVLYGTRPYNWGLLLVTAALGLLLFALAWRSAQREEV